MPPFEPLTANLTAVAVFSVALLIVFHATLVLWLRLGALAWKIVDYIWLGFAALGLIGAVGQVRIASASSQLGLYEERAVAGFNLVKDLTKLYAATPGAICRTFDRSEFSPPPEQFDRTQREYEIACVWAKRTNEFLATVKPMPPNRLDVAKLPPRPQITNGALLDMFRGLDSQLGYWNRDIDLYQRLADKTRTTGLEASVVFLSPFILALALALRITKVTGEIALERQTRRSG